MKTTLLRLFFLLLVGDVPGQVEASRWKDDFSDPGTLAKNWTVSGFLASSEDKNPLGKPVAGAEARSDWWQIVDGALRGQSFPEEKHSSGISHAVGGKDLRLNCRFKIPKSGRAGMSFRGENPIVERNFTVAAIFIYEDGVRAIDNDVAVPKGSSGAIAMADKGEWNRRFFTAKAAKWPIAPDVWHDFSMEIKGRELTASVDGRRILIYTTLCGDVAKTSLGLGVGDDPARRVVLATWYDDVSVEPVDR